MRLKLSEILNAAMPWYDDKIKGGYAKQPYFCYALTAAWEKDILTRYQYERGVEFIDDMLGGRATLSDHLLLDRGWPIDAALNKSLKTQLIRKWIRELQAKGN